MYIYIYTSIEVYNVYWWILISNEFERWPCVGSASIKMANFCASVLSPFQGAPVGVSFQESWWNRRSFTFWVLDHGIYRPLASGARGAPAAPASRSRGPCASSPKKDRSVIYLNVGKWNATITFLLFWDGYCNATDIPQLATPKRIGPILDRGF